MARHAAHVLLKLACGASLPWICTSAMADPPKAAPVAAAAFETEAGPTDIDAASEEAGPADLGPVALPSDETNAVPSTPAIEATEEGADAAPTVEVIRERNANGTVKIERHVLQDSQGNYLNHGLWSHWDEKGKLIGSGEFKSGKREGRWTRVYLSNEGPMFKGPMYQEFQAPFSSEAEFENGVLHGTWRTYDSRNRKMSEFIFDHGKRTGKSIWWHVGGQKRREVDYSDDDIDGEVLEWTADNKLTVRDKYIAGHKLSKQVEYYSPGQKKSEGWILFARELVTTRYDWWQGIADVKVEGKDGIDRKHGAQTAWHSNGQKRMQGAYEANLPVGKFTFWYANGQKQFEGEYIEGKEHGRFIWWHPNGQKQLEGLYLSGGQTGKWMRWNTEGKVTEVGDYSDIGRKVEEVQKPAIVESHDEEHQAPVRNAKQNQGPAMRR